MAIYAKDPPKKGPRQPRPPKPGVSTPGVEREMATITPEAVFRGNARLVITDEAVWVSNGPKNTIHKLDPKTNKVEAASRLAASDALDSLPDLEASGVPSCSDKAVSRVDIRK